MFKEIFTVLLLPHIIGDFYFQTQRAADKKDQNFKWVIFHCAAYFAAMLLMSFLYPAIYPVMFVLSLLHFLIDSAKYFYVRRNREKNRDDDEKETGNQDKRHFLQERNVFVADQCLHILCIVAAAFYVGYCNLNMTAGNFITDIFAQIGIPLYKGISWITALLLIWKPANILIQKMLAVYKPDEGKVDQARDYQAGRFIGVLERVIMLIFISLGQYAAIGLVLTAKSITRYDRIAKEKDFAEYYLLGTLLSTLSVIVISFLVR